MGGGLKLMRFSMGGYMDGGEQVIKGWDRGLMDHGMGCRVKLQITSDYAYGSSGWQS